MAMTARTGEGRSFADINMTPLIDVMLVLLIIFIITLPQQTPAVKIDNSSGAPPVLQEKPDIVELTIDFDGATLWNRMPVDHATLQGYMRQAARRPVQPEIHLVVDRSSRYEAVAQILADLQRQGLQKLGFVNSGV